MGYSIELYFDWGFEEKLRALWGCLEKAGVPSILQKIGSRPHISLLILDQCDVAQVAELIESSVNGLHQFPISFPAVSLIPGRLQTVFLTPAMNSELIAIQGSLYTLLDKAGYSVREHYEPGNWLPHCSISKELSAVDALKTLAICQDNLPTGKTWVTDVGFIAFRPRKLITMKNLIKNSDRLMTSPL